MAAAPAPTLAAARIRDRSPSARGVTAEPREGVLADASRHSAVGSSCAGSSGQGGGAAPPILTAGAHYHPAAGAKDQLRVGTQLQVSHASPNPQLRGMVGEVVTLGATVELCFRMLGVTVPLSREAIGTHLSHGLLEIIPRS